MLDADHRNHSQAEELGCFETANAGDDLAAAIDHDRIYEPEMENRISDSPDLLLGMCPGFAIRLPQGIQRQHQRPPRQLVVMLVTRRRGRPSSCSSHLDRFAKEA